MELTRASWWRRPRRRSSVASTRSAPSPGVPTASIPSGPTVPHEPDLDLVDEFLRSFDAFEAEIRLVCVYLGSRAGSACSLHDQVGFLTDLGVLDKTMRNTWADCLRVRARELLGAVDDRPGREDIERSLGDMTGLRATLSTQIGQDENDGTLETETEIRHLLTTAEGADQLSGEISVNGDAEAP